MDDKREQVVHYRKLGYQKMNDLNESSRKIKSAKAILNMKRDHVWYQGEAILNKLAAKLELLRSHFSRELTSIVDSKLKFLDDCNNRILDSQCMLSEVCMEAQRVLKYENEDILNQEAEGILQRFMKALAPTIPNDLMLENLIDLGFRGGDCDKLLEQNVLGYLVTKDKMATPVMVPIALSAGIADPAAKPSGREASEGGGVRLQITSQGKSLTLQQGQGQGAAMPRNSQEMAIRQGSQEARPTAVENSHGSLQHKGSGDGTGVGTTDRHSSPPDRISQVRLQKSLERGREQGPGQAGDLPASQSKPPPEVSNGLGQPGTPTVQQNGLGWRGMAKLASSGGDRPTLYKSLGRGSQRIGSGRLVRDESDNWEDVYKQKELPNEDWKPAPQGSWRDTEAAVSSSVKRSPQTSSSVAQRFVFNHLGIHRSTEEQHRSNKQGPVSPQHGGQQSRAAENQHGENPGWNGGKNPVNDSSLFGNGAAPQESGTSSLTDNATFDRAPGGRVSEASFDRAPGGRVGNSAVNQTGNAAATSPAVQRSASGSLYRWVSPELSKKEKGGAEDWTPDKASAAPTKKETPPLFPQVPKITLGAASKVGQELKPSLDLTKCMGMSSELDLELQEKLSAGFHFATGVTMNSRGDVVVADTGSHTVKLLRNGQLLFEIPKDISQQVNFRRPSAVVTNAKDDIIVKDDVCIHLFDKDGHLKMCMGKNELKRPYGLALTDDSKVLVLDTPARKHRLYHFDQETGEQASYQFMPLWGKVDEESKCRFLAYHNGNVLVSDLGKSLMYLTTAQGEALRTFGGFGRGPGQLNQPSGVAVDSCGNWIVGDSRNDRLQLFNPNGDYLCKVKLPIPLKRPSGIFLSPSGLLLVIHYLDHIVSVFRVQP